MRKSAVRTSTGMSEAGMAGRTVVPEQGHSYAQRSEAQ